MFAVWHHAKQPKAERCSGPSPSPGPVPAVTKEQVYKRLLIMSFTHVVQNHLGFVLDFCPLSGIPETRKQRAHVSIGDIQQITQPAAPLVPAFIADTIF